MTRPCRAAGFSLIELMVTITLMSILVMLAVPSFSEWVQNNKVRTVSESLQNGLRLAQTEALRRSRQVVFSLTNSSDPKTSLTAVANGRNWSLNTVNLMTDDLNTADATLVEYGKFAAVGTDVTITGPVSICFNSVGRMVANSNPGPTNAVCTVSTAAPVVAYNVSATNATRPLRVTVGLGGQVRMCDPARTLSTTATDGC